MGMTKGEPKKIVRRKKKEKPQAAAPRVNPAAVQEFKKHPGGSAEINLEMLRDMQDNPIIKKTAQLADAVHGVVFAPAKYIYDKTIEPVVSAVTQAQQDFLDGCKKLENAISGRTSESKSTQSEETDESDASNTPKPK